VDRNKRNRFGLKFTLFDLKMIIKIAWKVFSLQREINKNILTI
jgi:hypothetical protein